LKGLPVNRHIFTYGSLMFGPVWNRVVRGRYPKHDARLYGYCRRRIQGQTYPAVMPASDDDHVAGKLYLNVDEIDLRLLDRFEGEYYHRVLAPCELPDGSKYLAGVYVLKGAYRHLLQDEEWDPVWFGKVGMKAFLESYQGFDGL
jgi:gamma-glutamylcyclotransferase (GGCT)/AIG2-like uncharacterized protein YtfP